MYFTVLDNDPDLEERILCEYSPLSDQEPTPDAWGAEICAAYYHAKHDGWEATWPLTFVLFDEHDHEVGRFVVSCKMEPVFHVYCGHRTVHRRHEKGR